MSSGEEARDTGFRRSETVRFQHCDPAGIVFYPRYVEMVNATVEDWFAALGCSFAELHGPMKAGIPAVALNVEFRAPSRLGQELAFAVLIDRRGRSSVTLRIECSCAQEARFVATVTLVYISLTDYRARPWPEAIGAAIVAATA